MTARLAAADAAGDPTATLLIVLILVFLAVVALILVASAILAPDPIPAEAWTPTQAPVCDWYPFYVDPDATVKIRTARVPQVAPAAPFDTFGQRPYARHAARPAAPASGRHTTADVTR